VVNAEIAGRLDAFAAVLELGDANPYTIRAYRRAAESVRHSAVPVDELVAAGRGRELRGIGPGIETRRRSSRSSRSAGTCTVTRRGQTGG
jgi:DNA polymerase/3'-5' exonuclease PolX